MILDRLIEFDSKLDLLAYVPFTSFYFSAPFPYFFVQESEIIELALLKLEL